MPMNSGFIVHRFFVGLRFETVVSVAIDFRKLLKLCGAVIPGELIGGFREKSA